MFVISLICLIAAQFSIEWVIIGFVLQTYGFMFYNMFTINKHAGWTVKDDFKILMPATGASILMAAAIVLLKKFVVIDTPILALIFFVTVGCVVYGAVHLIAFRENALRVISSARKHFSPSA